MSRKKHKHEEHVDESWLVPYSDLLTLLLALFIVMFAMSQVDQKKFEQFGKAWEDAVNSGFVNVESKANKEGELEEEPATPAEEVVISSTEIEELKDLQTEVEAYIKEHHYEEEMATKYTDDGLLIVIKDNILFNSGSAVLDAENVAVIAPLATILNSTESATEIIVSGHTDNVPVHNALYDSNWRLSMDRAVNFMTELIKGSGRSYESFSARGYGETKPLAPNDTAANKAINRRVEVLIRPKFNLNPEKAESATETTTETTEKKETEVKTEKKSSGH